MRPLSFPNPWLYSDGYKALTNIADGGSTGCNTFIPYASWNATTGWDRVTGLGRPNLQKIVFPRLSIRTCVFADLSVPAIHNLVLRKVRWQWIKLKVQKLEFCMLLAPTTRQVIECNFVRSLLYGSKGGPCSHEKLFQ